MSQQPFRGDERIIVEARDENGRLRFDVEQPPTKFLNTDLDTLYRQGMWQDPAFKDAVGSAENLRKWLKSKSWTIRARYW